MSYKKKIVSVAPGGILPELEHTAEFYCHRELVKKQGRRKKEDLIEFQMTFIPWDDINDTELMALAVHGKEFGSREEMELWNVLCRGLRRIQLIELITGKLNPQELPANPTHVARDRLSRLIHNNWRYIHSQIRCNTLCWECSDVKPLECILENSDMLRGEDI